MSSVAQYRSFLTLHCTFALLPISNVMILNLACWCPPVVSQTKERKRYIIEETFAKESPSDQLITEDIIISRKVIKENLSMGSECSQDNCADFLGHTHYRDIWQSIIKSGKRITGADSTDPLIPENTEKWRRKRKTSAGGPPNYKKRTEQPQRNICQRPPLIAEPTPRREKLSNQYCTKWLEQCETGAPLNDEPIENIYSEQVESGNTDQQKFVMVQVFRRDALLKSDLVPLNDGDNSEIHISYNGDTATHPDTTNFRSFVIARSDPYNSDQFKHHFSKGIRLYCRDGKEVSLRKSTGLPAYYETQNRNNWDELPTEKWRPVFNFSRLNRDTMSDAEYNLTTSRMENVVRVTVGCEPNYEKIYETAFHIKLSFVAH